MKKLLFILLLAGCDTYIPIKGIELMNKMCETNGGLLRIHTSGPAWVEYECKNHMLGRFSTMDKDIEER